MVSNEQIVRDFVATWPRLDADAIVAFFAEDGIYHNIPIEPVQGHAQLKEFITGFLASWTKTHWDILSMTSAGDTVVVERIDHIFMGDKSVDLPCCGVFEMKDGKIKAWRDYFDMGTYMKALG
ncbi:MAG: limonene-1,2-epoxide hydrolase [Alphaproteobacteria bacterium]|nr:limonene-1,2-epoxide hydrolase [Alphaproteobacteria bacterium]